MLSDCLLLSTFRKTYAELALCDWNIVIRKMNAKTLRQYFIYTGLVLCSVSDGFVFGQMSGMVDALRGKDDDLALSDDDVSWIASTINATCIFGFIVSGVLTEKVGRRRAISYLSLPMFMTWIMIYFATNLATFIASRVIVGVSYGGVISLIYVAIAEYTTPGQRAIWVNMVSAVAPSLGTSLGHVLCIVFHWRTVALIGGVLSGLSALLPLFWIESPSWLASKRRFDECAEAYRKLYDCSEASEAELNMLIKEERVKQEYFSKNEEKFSYLEKIKKVFTQSYFWRIIALSIVISIYRVAGGRILYNTLAITMLKEMTGSSNILMFTSLLDGFIMLASFLPIFLLMKMKLRTMLFLFGLLSNFVLVVLCICLYFIPKENIYYAWIVLSLLGFYFIAAYAGPYAVLEILLAEIYPLELKAFCIFVFGAFAGTAQFLSIKWATRMFSLMGYHGVFLLNSAIVFLCIVYLWFYMPETKGKTMQEIEIFFKSGKFPDKKDFLHDVKSESIVLL